MSGPAEDAPRQKAPLIRECDTLAGFCVAFVTKLCGFSL
jgi:hypothetical protein